MFDKKTIVLFIVAIGLIGYFLFSSYSFSSLATDSGFDTSYDSGSSGGGSSGGDSSGGSSSSSSSGGSGGGMSSEGACLFLLLFPIAASVI